MDIMEKKKEFTFTGHIIGFRIFCGVQGSERHREMDPHTVAVRSNQHAWSSALGSVVE